MIRFREEESHIKLQLEKKGLPYRIDLHLRKNKNKGIAVNGIPIRRTGELFGILHAVFFSPEDLNLIKEGPAERRRFLDTELCQLDRVYLHALGEYHRILAQRNRLLKELSGKRDWSDTLDVWDMQLIKYGRLLIGLRRSFIEKINAVIDQIHFSISGEREHLQLIYDMDTEEENYEKRLREHLEQDIRSGSTGVGPHRDDVGFFAGSLEYRENAPMDLRRFGSQGQQRTAALSLKLAEIEIVKESIGEYPVLLLDDVLSELDAGRQDKLLQSIRHLQTIITCTGVEDFFKKSLKADKVMRIALGRVYEDEEQRIQKEK